MLLIIIVSSFLEVAGGETSCFIEAPQRCTVAVAFKIICTSEHPMQLVHIIMYDLEHIIIDAPFQYSVLGGWCVHTLGTSGHLLLLSTYIYTLPLFLFSEKQDPDYI